jgi:Fe-S oxidoreductase
MCIRDSYTQYLAELIEKSRLAFNHPFKEGGREISGTEFPLICTFQDPCYLGRHNKEYAAPRNVLKAIPGIELVEMVNSHQNGLCCGGGGGRMWLETAPGQRFSDLRIREAKQAGAGRLVTACPFCTVCLEDSLKASRMNDLQVLDIAELAASAL